MCGKPSCSSTKVSRDKQEYAGLTGTPFSVPRNYDPALHPLEGPREYVRALNATKLDRVFAKPFVCNLSGHRDGVSCFGKHPKQLSCLATGAYDGEVRIWDLANRASSRNFVAHDGFVRGITYTQDGGRIFTVGDDKTIKVWKAEAPEVGEDEVPVNTILSKLTLSIRVTI